MQFPVAFQESKLTDRDRRLAIIGLGYVGLPVAVAFAKKFPGTIGYDVDTLRVESLAQGIDWTGEIDGRHIMESELKVTSQVSDLSAASVFIVCVPTPIYNDHRPDLRPLQLASETVGSCLRKGNVVVYESTVYPGVTEEICGTILSQVSGLRQGVDFKLGYSPERINPGDKEHSFEHIKKVVAAEDEPTAQMLADIYGAVVQAGVYVAKSIKIAEVAKILENTQRDINIALMNELALICDLMKIRTKDVLEAAATKWNFYKFSPGLVGGHCIGVDPYYLTYKAEELGYHPEVILAGRRINDSMGAHIARRIVRFLADGERPLREMRVGILGITFKENIPDIRNSRVPHIISELLAFGISSIVHDPLADAKMVHKEYGLKLSTLSSFRECDVVVLAVPHADYLANQITLWSMVRDGGLVVDVRSALEPEDLPAGMRYWSL